MHYPPGWLSGPQHSPGPPAALGPEAYRALYENSPDGVLFTVPDGRVLAANAAACRILGRTEAEIRARGRQGLVDPTDDRWARMVADRRRDGGVSGTGRMLRGDGTAIEVEVSAQIFHDEDGGERTCTTIRDITDRAAMERELRRSRARLAEAERVAQMGSWEWDLGSDRITWSDGLLALFGLAREDLQPSLAGGIAQRVYPEDRPLVSGTLRRAVADRSSFSLEYRALRADGRVRTLRSRGEVVVDPAGEPLRVVGIARDITDARLAQEALERTSSELGRRALELQDLAVRTAGESGSYGRAALTARQLEIVRLVAAGLTTADIARRLFVSQATVKWHVRQILTKTGAANRAEAVARVLGTSPDR